MDVYPTRRTASFPQRIYEFTAKNAVNCKLVANGEGVENCAEGLPFPIPNDGYEVIWNHKLKYKGVAVQRWANQTSPTAGGAFNLVRLREELLGLYYKQGNTTENINNILVYFFQDVEGAGAAGRQRAAGARDPQPGQVRRARHGSTTPASAACGARRTSPTTTRAPRRTACAPTT